MIYIFIFILTLGDVVFTVWGVVNKHIEEANPLLANVMHSYPVLTGIGVLVFAGLLLIFLSKQRIKWLGYAVGGLLVIKIGVMFLHANWISQI
jgi:hypothetical protein